MAKFQKMTWGSVRVGDVVKLEDRGKWEVRTVFRSDLMPSTNTYVMQNMVEERLVWERYEKMETVFIKGESKESLTGRNKTVHNPKVKPKVESKDRQPGEPISHWEKRIR